LLLSHLSQIEDNWENFLSQNGFSQTNNTVNPPLNVNLNCDSPVTEIQGFIPPDGYEINESVSISLQNPIFKKSLCIFSSSKSLEQVVGELKGKYSPILASEPNMNNSDKPTIRKFRKGKKQNV
jgi:hypothetical protein